MDRNLLHEAAALLIEYGYRVFPCVAGAKHPATEHGLRDATSDEDVTERWWNENPAYNVAVVTDGLCVIDIDPLPDGTPNGWMKTLSVDQVDSLKVAPQTITPRSGVHLWFRQPAELDLRNTASVIAERVDTRANGGYVLVPPSRVADHGPYRYAPFRELDCGPASLPEVPGWLVDILTNRKPATVESAQDEPIPEGRRNVTLASLAGKLRQIGLDAGAIDAALQRTNAARCVPPLDPNEVSQIARSVGRYEPDQTAQAMAEGWIEEDDEEEDRPDIIPDPGPFPPELLNVPGFLGDVIAFNLRGAVKRQPELALAGALALLATITGRKVADETDTRTNLMIIGLCESGGGKERARKVNKALLTAAGMEIMIGAEEFKSESGLMSSLDEQPARLYQLDELGRWLAQVASSAQSSMHLKAVITKLMNLYTSSNEIVISGAVADRNRVKTIRCPHAVVYGTSVPQNVLEALTTENTNDGFLSRTLLIEARDNDPPVSPIIVEEPPAPLAQAVRWWGEYTPSGNLNDINPIPRRLTTDPVGAELYAQLTELSSENRRRYGQYAGIWVRAIEQARKLSLLHQLSVDREATEIGIESVSWGCAMVEHSLGRMMFLADNWVSENWYQKCLKRVVRVLRDNGGQVNKTHITRSLSNLPLRQIDELIERLTHDGIVVAEKQTKTGRPGPRPTMYRLAHLSK